MHSALNWIKKLHPSSSSIKFCILKMSKNTASNAFRKIDVDQFNEDNFKDEETPQDAGFAGVNESEVSNLLSKGNAGEALKLLLSSAPIGSKNQADKVKVYH